MAANNAWMELTVGGRMLVDGGCLVALMLEEELNTAALVTLEIELQQATRSLISTLQMGTAMVLELGEGDATLRSLDFTLVELQHRMTVEGWRLTARGVDKLVTLKHRRQTRVWEVSASAVVQELAGNHGLSAQLQGVAPTTEVLVQNNLSSAEMLARLARQYNYVGQLDGSTLLYGRNIDSTSVTVDLSDGVRDLEIHQSMLGIPTKVEVWGYDWKQQQAAVQGTATAADLQSFSAGATGSALVQKTYGEVKLLVESNEPLTPGDARELAVGLLQQRTERFLEGSLSCDGEPSARPGRSLTLTGFEDLNGSYRIRATRHELRGADPYRTFIEFFSDGQPS